MKKFFFIFTILFFGVYATSCSGGNSNRQNSSRKGEVNPYIIEDFQRETTTILSLEEDFSNVHNEDLKLCIVHTIDSLTSKIYIHSLYLKEETIAKETQRAEHYLSNAAELQELYTKYQNSFYSKIEKDILQDIGFIYVYNPAPEKDELQLDVIKISYDSMEVFYQEHFDVEFSQGMEILTNAMSQSKYYKSEK